MKRLIVLASFLAIVSIGIGQQQQHLTFKGVPIDGTIKEYTNTMIKAGFHYKGTNNGVSMLTGDFAGYKDCMIHVATLSNCDVVSHIAVLFPDRDTWSSLLNDYEKLKAMLTTKYGTPKHCSERFTGYVGSSDNLKLLALDSGEYEWYTVFSTEFGDIELSLEKGSSYSTGAVCLSYFDKINSEKVFNSAMDDL